jgi:hypothetical protein
VEAESRAYGGRADGRGWFVLAGGRTNSDFLGGRLVAESLCWFVLENFLSKFSGNSQELLGMKKPPPDFLGEGFLSDYFARA